MDIVILDGYTLNPGDLSWEGLEALGNCRFYDRTPADRIVERIGTSEIVFTNKTPLGREVFEACPQIRYIGVLATGYNVVDVSAAKVSGIIVTNIPAYGTNAVAQHVFALLLEICSHAGKHDEAVRAGRWQEKGDFCFWDYPLIELAGKTMGIIGYGRIGSAVAKLAQAFGMKVIAHSLHPDKALENENLKFSDLEELLENSDVISLHCPLFDTTKGMINKDSISRMKQGAIIINTSRGPLIVEDDLADALNSGRIYAAAMDVVSSEPIKADNPLLKARNCVITPHIAWAPKESRIRLFNIAVENLEKFLKGTPVNVVS